MRNKTMREKKLTLQHCPVHISAWSSNNWWTQHKAKASLLKNTHFSSKSKISRSSEAESKQLGAPEHPMSITAAVSSPCLYLCMSNFAHLSRAPWAFKLIGRLQKDIDGCLQPTQWYLSCPMSASWLKRVIIIPLTVNNIFWRYGFSHKQWLW